MPYADFTRNLKLLNDMRNKKNSALKGMIFNRLTRVIFGMVMLVLISIPLGKNLIKQSGLNMEIEELRREIEKMEGKNNDLNSLIDYLSSDQFVMEQARMNLNYKKPGEEMVVVKGTDSLSASSKTEQQQDPIYQIKGFENQKPEKKAANPQKWWNYFFKINI
jgi:cell division protein FtsB